MFGLHLLARCIVGANQQVADNTGLLVAQRGNRHHGRKPTAVFTDIGQLVDVFNAARSLEHQRFETRRNGSAKLQGQHFGAGNDLVRVRNIGGCDLVHHIIGRVTEHMFGAHVENLNHTLGIGGNTGKIRAVENGAL